MRAQDEKIKGFSLLELLVVVVIIGVISGVGYPKFNEWRIDRETRSSVIKIKSLFDGINAQVKRGQYAFVQVHIKEAIDTDKKRKLFVTSKGMQPAKLGNLIFDGTSTWWSNINGRCNTDTSIVGYWDDDPTEGSDKIEVRQIKLDNVATTWVNTHAAVCFGKNEKWFSAAGDLASDPSPPSEGGEPAMDSLLKTPKNQLFVCRRTAAMSKCDVNETANKGEGAPESTHKQLFKIEWSRFGNLALKKWDKKKAKWVNQ